MDGAALEKILQVADAAMTSLDAENGLALVPQGYNIKDLDGFRDRPRHFKEIFATHDIRAFGDYVNDTAEVYTGSMWNLYLQAWTGAQDTLKADITFDCGTPAKPGHGFHRASLSLRRTPLLNAVDAIEGQPLTKRQLIEFVEDWHPDLSGSRPGLDGDEIPIAGVLRALREFKIKSSQDMTLVDKGLATSRSQFDEMDADSPDMPAYIVATGVPFDGLDEVDMRLRLIVNLPLAGDTKGEPMFKLKMVKKDVFLKELETDFAQKLLREFETTADQLSKVKLMIGRLG